MPESPLAAVEYEQFLADYSFALMADTDETSLSYTVFGNLQVLVAFTYQQHDGENIVVAPLGSPITTSAISSRSEGWQLIGGVLPDFWLDLHQARHAVPYPHKLDRPQETLLVDRALRRFMQAEMGPNNSSKPTPLRGAA